MNQVDNGLVPLCVDLDGTLLRTDSLYECLVRAVKLQPWVVFLLPLWLSKGKQYLKFKLSENIQIDYSLLPYNPLVLQAIEEAGAQGRQVYLVTGAPEVIAQSVFNSVPGLTGFYSSCMDINLTDQDKADFLVKTFGADSFDYIGDSSADLKVWARSKTAIVCAQAQSDIVKRAECECGEISLLEKPYTGGLKVWLKALRIHQWAKNALIFVPALTSHHMFDLNVIVASLIAFVCFGICASSTYIINDLFDLDADRGHAKKKNRPFAAGTLSILHGIIVAMLGLLLSLSVAICVNTDFFIVLVVYLIFTLLYSFVLKRLSSIDVIVLAGLYTIRVIAGALAIGVQLSFWLLAFSMFIFLCLALAKRVAELIEKSASQSQKVSGREYTVADLPILQIMGATSGYIGVLVLALYINSAEVVMLYSKPMVLWIVAPILLLWVTRLWMVTSRGYMNEDPILFAIRDPETWITALCTVAIMYFAS